MNLEASVIVSSAEMRSLEEAAVRAGRTEEALMEMAGAGLGKVVRQFWPNPGAAVVFCGKGHNAGDACVLARLLLDAGWPVELRMAFPVWSWRPLAREKFSLIEGRVAVAELDSAAVPAGRPLLLVDGLLGIGAGGALKDPVKQAAAVMNRLRLDHDAETLAVDLPSGLDADTGAADADTVIADVTVTLGFPKSGLTAPGAERFTGRLAHVPIALTPPEGADLRDQWITPALLRPLMKRRGFGMHKGQAGRVGIVAGSRGLTGAARLAAMGAVAAGGGLVTLFCPHDVYEILAALCPPEIMVRPVHSCREVMTWNLDAVGIGPGMGPAPLSYMATQVTHDPRPMVVDADALNAIAAHRVPPRGEDGGPRLLTPHPGELARLGAAFGSGGADVAESLADLPGVTVLSKSARSAVVAAGQPRLINTTGHPMMAKGGFGDVLTGFCTAFAAQGMSLRDSAALGSWLLGHAAELARIQDCGAVESFTPSRLLEMTGPALVSLRSGAVF